MKHCLANKDTCMYYFYTIISWHFKYYGWYHSILINIMSISPFHIISRKEKKVKNWWNIEKNLQIELLARSIFQFMLFKLHFSTREQFRTRELPGPVNGPWTWAARDFTLRPRHVCFAQTSITHNIIFPPCNMLKFQVVDHPVLAIVARTDFELWRACTALWNVKND